MAWYIIPQINNGYPFADGFPTDFLTSFISDGSHQYPYSAWRIGSGVNGGYPWKFWWFEAPVSDSGDMETGGSQSNYPTGFTVGDMGGISDQFDDTDMGFNTDLVDDINLVFSTALSNKMFGLSHSQFAGLIALLNDPSSMGPNYDPTVIQKMYGANVYDGILICRMYPFDVLVQGDSNTIYPAIFGQYRLYGVTINPDESVTPLYGYTQASNVIRQFGMGSLSLDIFQAWEVEHISFYIYLPCAGVFPLDVRDGSEVNVTLFVDILSGVGEYTVKQNGQTTAVYKINMGIDVPINLSQGQIAANHTAFITNQMARIAGVATPIASAVNPALGLGLGVAAGAISQMSGQGSSLDVSTPSVGSGVGMAGYPYARIIAKIPKMFNSGYGYHETQGANRSTTYVNLSTCSGFVQCKNYKSDIIIATEDEKREIENLMNAGVFL